VKVALYNLTTTTQFGGVESFVWEVASRLAAQGVEATIVSGRGPHRRGCAGVRIVEFPFVSRARLRRVPGLAKAYTLTKLLERLTFGAAAFDFMRRADFDFVHIQKPYDLPFGILLKTVGAGRMVFGCHGTDFFPGDVPLARRANASVSCSAFNAGQVRAHYGFTPRVVFNGTDPDLFHPQSVDPARRLALAGDGALVLYIGRLVRWKGVQYLISALTRLNQSVHLIVVGAGEYGPTLEAQTRDLGLAGRVHFRGFVPPVQLPELIAACDLLCVPSYANETFSISAVEALACERPVVGSNFGGIPEVIVDGETGLLARPEDAEDLAAKLDALLTNPEKRAEMGQRGRARTLELFTWDKVTERVLSVYGESAGRRGPGSEG
jgi:glycosyltransferase involved in cell wall biosynthesis